MMKRKSNDPEPLYVFDSLDELLSPESLGRVLGAPVGPVERSPLQAAHFSGSTLESVRTVRARLPGDAPAGRGPKPVRLVLKRFSYERDWVMQRTHDTRVRESALYRQGVYARLPARCLVPVIATAKDGDSWATLMRDVSDSLAPAGRRMTAADLDPYLRGLAAFHGRFLNDESLVGSALGLSSLLDFVAILSPEGVRGELEAGRAPPILERCLRGWEVFAEIAPPDAVGIVHELQRDPAPLVAALETGPRTLLHGDYKLANLGRRGVQTVILDWQDAAFGPPLLDLGYFLAIHPARRPASIAAAARRYRVGLAACGYAYPNSEWERALALGLLAGGAMRLLWQKALAAVADDPAAREHGRPGASRPLIPGPAGRAMLGWWAGQVVKAARWLG